MFKLLLLVAAVLVLDPQAVKGQLVGAQNASIGEFLYQVSVRILGKHCCGGALITRKHVLTAAHCVLTAKEELLFSCFVTAVVGTHNRKRGGTSYCVRKKYHHQDYVLQEGHAYWVYDIGILKLAREVALSNQVAIVKLPTEDVQPGTEAVVSSWGSMYGPDTKCSKTLQKIKTRIIDRDTCQKKMPPSITVYSTYICTYRRGSRTCTGDSGSPLVQDNIVIGVVAGGVVCRTTGFPDIYTNVYKFMDDFVTKIIAQ